MGQRRQSQGNDRQNTARQKSGKRQRADSDNASSRASAGHVPQQQQQQDPGTGRSPRESGDGSAPRAGSNRNADNPSLSANQQDRRGQSGSQRGGDSVEALKDEQDSQDSKR